MVSFHPYKTSGTGLYEIFDSYVKKPSAIFAKNYLTKAIRNELNLNASDSKTCKYVKEPNLQLDSRKMLTDFIAQAETHLKTMCKKSDKSGTTSS